MGDNEAVCNAQKGRLRVLVPSLWPVQSISARLTNAHPDCPPLRERAVNLTPATVPLAPSPSTATAPTNTIEYRVGAIVAAAGMVIVEALDERQHGALSPRTKMRGGDLICELFRWRKFLIADYPTFDAMAREHGAVVLRAAGVSPVTADLLATEVLDLLGKVVRTALN